MTLTAITAFVVMKPKFDGVEMRGVFGFSLLCGSQFVSVLRNAAARRFSMQNSRRLHKVSYQHASQPEGFVDAGEDSVEMVSVSMRAELDTENVTKDNSTTGSLPLFSAAGPLSTSRLDDMFEAPLYLYRPLSVGVLGSFELGTWGGSLLLCPAAYIAYRILGADGSLLPDIGVTSWAIWYVLNFNQSLMCSMVVSKLTTVNCSGWLSVSSIIAGPVSFGLAYRSSVAATVAVEVISTIAAALVGATFVEPVKTGYKTEENFGTAQVSALFLLALGIALLVCFRSKAEDVRTQCSLFIGLLRSYFYVTAPDCSYRGSIAVSC